MTEKISFVEFDLDRCSNRYGVVGDYADPSGNVSYPSVTNSMPSPFDPSGWTGANDTDLAYQSVTETNPSGQSFVGEFEYVGTGTAPINYSTNNNAIIGGKYYISLLIKPESGTQLGFRFSFQEGAATYAAGTVSAITGSWDVFGSPPVRVKTEFLSNGYLLAQIEYTSEYNITNDFDIYTQFYKVNDSGVQITLPTIGDKIKCQAAFFGKADDWPALVGLPSNCTASIPATGTDKCFNCLATCQDKANYASEIVTERFSTVTSKPPTIDAIPNIASVNIRPAKLELGESIGIRASVDIQLKDSRSPDTGPSGDYYLADRDYDPYTQGTFFGKLRARYPFTQGSNIRLIRGDTDQSLDQMETRHFIVDKLAGPDSSGSFSITCKDALKLADGKKAQWPKLDSDNVKLATDLLIGGTSFTIDPFDKVYAVGGGGQYLNIGGNEIVKLLSKTGAGTALDPYVYTCSRGQFNTEISDHKIGDRLQACRYYQTNTAKYIIEELLTSGAGIPSEYIPSDDWTLEQDTYLQKLYTAVIAEPTSVTDLINELLEQTASTLWWDDSARLLRWEILKSVNSDAALYSDDLIIANSFSAADQPQKRISQVWTYYGQIDPTKKLDEKDNYATSLITLSEESEANYNESSIKKIFSRWITKEATDAADKLNKTILSRYTNPPRSFAFKLQKGDQLLAPSLGGGYNLRNWTLQTATGASQLVPIQTVQVKSTDTDYMVLAEEVLYTETITPDNPNIVNLTLTTDYKNLNMRSFFNAGGNIATSDTVFTLTIGQSFNVYSETDGLAALTTGDWPAGAVINLVVNGLVAGKGGDAGDGASTTNIGSTFSATLGQNGENGGIAVSASYDLVITVGINGLIGGGGGGGGGGGAAVYAGFAVNGGGGSGSPAFGSGGLGGITTGSVPAAQPSSNSGGAATVDISGTVGLGVIWDLPSSLPTIVSGSGGNGGSFGNNGGNGTIGYGLPSLAGGGFATAGGAGGLAGPAINKNGFTVNITNNGTIKGAINA